MAQYRHDSGVQQRFRIGVYNHGAPPPPLHKHGLVQAWDPVSLSYSWFFLTAVFFWSEMYCDAVVRGKGGWIVLVVVPPAHTNILLATLCSGALLRQLWLG